MVVLTRRDNGRMVAINPAQVVRVDSYRSQDLLAHEDDEWALVTLTHGQVLAVVETQEEVVKSVDSEAVGR